MDVENKEPVVGFRVGAYNQGKTSVAPIDNISNVPQRMKDVVKVSFYLLEINPMFNSNIGIWENSIICS